MTDLVTVKHEKTKAEAQVPKDSLEIWGKKGWKPVDSTATEGAGSDSTTSKSRS